MEPKTISITLDKLLTDMSLGSASGKLTENTAVEILVNLQLENHIKYFVSTCTGFISLLNICNSYNMAELDKLLLDILSAYINKPESKLTQSKDRKILTNISEEICQNTPSLSILFNCNSKTKSDLLEAISTDIIMEWITNPNVHRINMVDLVVRHSTRHWQHFITNGVTCLSDNVSETNVPVYLPLIKSLTFNKAKESEYVSAYIAYIYNMYTIL